MQSIEKCRYIWSITNFTREKVCSKPSNSNNKTKCSLRSKSFEIALDDNNTKWHFLFFPRDDVDYSGLYVVKEATDDDDFTMLLSAAVRTSDHKILHTNRFEKAAKEIPPGKGWNKFLKIDSAFDDKNKYLLNDTLTLIIDIKLRRHDAPEKVDQNPIVDALANSFGSKEFSDITLICSNRKALPAHRFILNSRSSVFKTLLAAEMLEKKTSRIVINDIDGDTMQEILRFIYTNTVENLDELATKLIYAAEKYDLQDLKSMCAIELKSQITSDTVFEFLVLADRFNEKTLLEECMDFIDSNFEELKASEDFKKIGIDLMMKCMQYIKENSYSIIKLDGSL